MTVKSQNLAYFLFWEAFRFRIHKIEITHLEVFYAIISYVHVFNLLHFSLILLIQEFYLSCIFCADSDKIPTTPHS